MTPDEFARSSWQSSGTSAPLPPLDELRGRADAFRRKVARRNLVEFLAGILVIVAFGAMILFGPLAPMRIGAAFVIGGTLVVLWQLHRRASPLTPPEDGGQHSILDFQRSELVRQHDALDSVFNWYLLPLIPGMLVLAATPFLMMPVDRWQWPPLGVALRLVFIPAVFIGVWWINKLGARKLQQEIDRIDALRAE